jgi:predicted ATPase
MINAVELVNFKNFRRQRVELGRFTVFVGANGSGKTSVLEAVDLAVRAARPILSIKREGDRKITERRPRPERVFRGDRHCDWLYCRGGAGALQITCEMDRGDQFTVAATPPPGWPPPIAELGKERWDFRVTSADGDRPAEVKTGLHRLVFLHLNAAVLSKASYSRLTPPRVLQDGSGLATVLAFMALNDPDTFNRLVEEMRALIPQLKRIRFTRARVQELEREVVRFGDDSVVRPLSRSFQGDAILFDYLNANDVAARTVSEGTLLLLGLLTVLLGPTRPGTLLLDDLEHGLHPRIQQELLGVLRRIMERFPDLQIIATAHSPYLLDGLQPDEVRLAAIGPDGYSVCGRLTDHPQFNKWKDEMSPGELWSLFGEKWLTQRQGEPA